VISYYPYRAIKYAGGKTGGLYGGTIEGNAVD